MSAGVSVLFIARPLLWACRCSSRGTIRYWYGPDGVVIAHPFHYAWGWEDYGWYNRYHGLYWRAYDVYPAPAYWVTDCLVAGYVADHYAASLSLAQAQEEARLAREEADKAREAAVAAREQTEIDAARTAQGLAEIRARDAETRLRQVEGQEASAGKPNANATPLNEQTKEALKSQIERSVAEKKALAEQSEKSGQPIVPDLSKALADPDHIYIVSKKVGVISAEDSKLAGEITEGDFLKLAPGQESKLANADDTKSATMTVITSKGEDGEVRAGTLISVPLRDLQDFDNEFNAKLDVALADADKNKDQFKQGAQ